VPSKVLGRGAFQDLDLTAVFRDVAAWTTTVHSGSDHAELAALAVKHALDGRGVAHLVLPDEVQTQPSDAAATNPQGRLAGRLTQPSGPELTRAAAMIKDWAAYAELCGATGIKADHRDQLEGAMSRLFAADGPALLHIEQDPELL